VELHPEELWLKEQGLERKEGIQPGRHSLAAAAKLIRQLALHWVHLWVGSTLVDVGWN